MDLDAMADYASLRYKKLLIDNNLYDRYKNAFVKLFMATRIHNFKITKSGEMKVEIKSQTEVRQDGSEVVFMFVRIIDGTIMTIDYIIKDEKLINVIIEGVDLIISYSFIS